MSRPRLVVTGASGFVGRHLLEALKDDYEIVGIARRSQTRSGAPVHPSIRWHQVDIADRDALVPVFDAIRQDGGAAGGGDQDGSTTSTGDHDEVVVPSPSWPCVLWPKQNTLAAVSAHE